MSICIESVEKTSLLGMIGGGFPPQTLHHPALALPAFGAAATVATCIGTAAGIRGRCARFLS